MRKSHGSNNYQMRHRHGYQQPQGQLFSHLSGAIFMCCNKTRKECFRRRIFGLPAAREPFVRQVKEGMYLFLFGADDRQMRGVFKAASNGGMNIVHGAFRSSGCSYPAQVRFNIECMYEPLTETEFRPAIQEKYYTDVKFNFDLNSDQVQRLLALFEAKKNSGVPQPISDRWDPSSSLDSPLNCSYSNRQRNIMSRVNKLGQRTLQVQITNPNPTTGGSSMLFMNSNTNFHQQGVVNSTSLCLAQQQGLFDYQTSTGTGVLYTQTMVPHMAYNSSLQQQTQPLLCVNPGNPQVVLSGYNPLNPSSSSQAVQVYAPNPVYSGNILMGVSTSSNFLNGDGQVHNGGAHLHSQFCNEAPQNLYYSNISQDVGIVGDLKTNPSAENPCLDQNPSVVCSGYPAESGKQLDRNPNSDPDPNIGVDADLGLNANPNLNSSLYSDVEQRKSVFSRLAQNSQRASSETHSHLTGADLSINQLPGHLIQQSRHQLGLNRADEPVYDKWVVQDEELGHTHWLAFADIEVSANLAGVVDGIDVDPTASTLNMKVELDESKLPLVDFKRRNGGNTLSTQLGGDKKKRRFIRPSLELEDEDSDLCALNGSMHKADMSSDKQSIEPFSVSIESFYNRETMVIIGATDVEGRVDSGTPEVLPPPVCKTTENFQTEVIIQGFQDNLKEEKVLLHSGSQKLLVPVSEKSDTLELEPKRAEEAGVNCSEGLPVLDELEPKSLNKVGVNFSEGKMDFMVLDEKTEKKNPIPNPEPIISGPEIVIKETSVLEPEPDNSKRLCLNNEMSNLVEEYIALKEYSCLAPEADSLKTGLEDYIALEPDVDNPTTFLSLHVEKN